jgi:hypothetical protein
MIATWKGTPWSSNNLRRLIDIIFWIKFTFIKETIFEHLHKSRITDPLLQTVHQTTTYSTCWIRSYSLDTILNPCLDYKKTREKTTKETEGEEVYHEEPVISGWTEGVDYDIVYVVGWKGRCWYLYRLKEIRRVEMNRTLLNKLLSLMIPSLISCDIAS